jgi:hypothetical protein
MRAVVSALRCMPMLGSTADSKSRFADLGNFGDRSRLSTADEAEHEV